jgi:hypothetical protein
MFTDDFDAFEREQSARFPEPAYGPKAIAAATGASRWLIDRAIRDGTLPAYRLGAQKLMVMRHDLLAWLWSRRAVPKEVAAPPSPSPKQVQRPRRGRPPEKRRAAR